MLAVHDICKSYAGNEVLRGVSLSLERGRCLCVAGANAAGKTTLLSIAAGMLRADGGTVEPDGRVGFLPQGEALLRTLSVRDNLRLWYAAAGAEKPFAEGSAEVRLGLLPFAKTRADALSGGTARRVMLAQALALRPDYLILDEPFAGLDLARCGDILALLAACRAQGTGLLLTAHEPYCIAQLADEVALLRGGRLEPPVPLCGDGAARITQVTELLLKQAVI